jgi:hypothetical protein
MLNRANLSSQSSSLPPKNRSTGNGSIQSTSKDQNRSRSNPFPEPLAGTARNALREDFEQVQAGMDQTPIAGFPVIPRRIASSDHQVRFDGGAAQRQPLIHQSFNAQQPLNSTVLHEGKYNRSERTRRQAEDCTSGSQPRPSQPAPPE